MAIPAREDLTVPPIPSEYLDCVVFLYPTQAQAETGNTADGGTGFLASTPLDASTLLGPDQVRALYVVTNRHCAERTPAIRLNTTDGAMEIITPEQSEWHYHPDGDDVAVLPLGLASERPQFQSVPVQSRHAGVVDEGWVVSEATFPKVQPGTDAFFVGRYVTHSGVQRNLPVVRFGSVAMTPTEPIEQGDGFKQDSFLVEARSQSGFSGSPVFVYNTMAGGLGAIRAAMGELSLVGIVCSHLPIQRPALDPTTRKPITQGFYVQENSNMACVVPAWKIVELIEQKKELIKLREAQKRKSTIVPE